MLKKKLAYVWSLRNAAADKAGQQVDYKGEKRFMKSPLQYLVEALNETPLGDSYSLEIVIYDDDKESERDCEKIKDYGFSQGSGLHWFYPPELTVQGRKVNDLLCAVPSAYRRLALKDPGRQQGKSEFEACLLDKLLTIGADLVVLDGLILILDELIRPDAPFHRKVVNIHPGITRLDSIHERRGAYATLDALYGAKGLRVIDWSTMETKSVPVVNMTGASFHYVDEGIDSGEVIADVLETEISPEDTILELRWNNFNNSLFPALYQGLEKLSGIGGQ